MTEQKASKSKLHNLIFIGMALGLLVGLGLHVVKGYSEGLFSNILWWLNLLGPTLFIGALKMIIAPLILASIVAGVTSLPNVRELGSIGYKTILYYLCTTTIAVVIGLLFVLTIRPGMKESSVQVRQARAAELTELRGQYEKKFDSPAYGEDGKPQSRYVAWLNQQQGEAHGQGEDRRWRAISGAKERTPGDIFKDDIIKPILMNPFAALSANPPNALGIIFFALLFGIACLVVGKPAERIVKAFHGLNEVIMKITNWLMLISPVAIGCIIAGLVAENDASIFQSLGWYSGTVITAIAAHIAMLVLIARFLGKVGPLRLWRGLREAWLIAFSTRSSAATLPITLNCVTKKLGVRPKVANFSLPLGATMNMDGTALYEGIAVIFLIQIYGGLDDVSITLTAMTTFVIFITAVLASVGAAAVPNAGLVTMVLVASAVHLPFYYIPLIFAVDALLDMFRTSTNVLGDAIGSVVVDRMIGRKEDAAVVPSESADP